MQIVDSHCHIDRVDLDAFGGSIESMLAHAGELSVNKFLCVCIDLEHFDQVHNLALEYPNIFSSVGVHPTETNCKDPSIEELLVYAKSDRVIAIGETGLDYFHVKKEEVDQKRKLMKAKRNNNSPLKKLNIKELKKQTFYKWLKSHDKLSGQSKIPRINNNLNDVDEILQINNT